MKKEAMKNKKNEEIGGFDAKDWWSPVLFEEERKKKRYKNVYKKGFGRMRRPCKRCSGMFRPETKHHKICNPCNHSNGGKNEK